MKAKAFTYLRKYFSHVLVAVLTLAFFSTVYTALAVNYVTPGLTLDPGADFPVLCADPLNDCTTEILRIGNPIGGATSGSIPFVDASGELAQDNAALFWDETNDRLGIGTNTPSHTLDLSETVVAPIVAEDNTSVAGLEDATFGGNYIGSTVDAYCIEIFDDVTVPNTFNFYDSGCGNLASSNVSITAGVAQAMDNGVTVTFASDSGHTAGDVWFVNLTPGTYSGDINFGGSLYRGGALYSGALGGVVSGATANSMLFVDASGLLAEDATFTYDDTSTTLFINSLDLVRNLDLTLTTGSTVGNITRDGQRMLHFYSPVATTAASKNLFLGYQAGNYSLTGTTGRNIGVGSNSLDSLTTGITNNAFGFNAGTNITIGQSNNFFGGSAGANLTTGTNNTGVGQTVLFGGGGLGTNTGSYNVAMGDIAMYQITDGLRNAGVGYAALENVTSGDDNAALGYAAGNDVGTGSRGTYLGSWTDNDALIADVSDVIAIGHFAIARADHQMVVGSDQSYIDDVYFGKGVKSATPLGVTINATGGFGTDIAGASLQLAGGKGTGNATGGDIIFSTANAGASGLTLQTLSEKMRLSYSGNLGIGDTTPDFRLDVEQTTDGVVATFADNDNNCTIDPDIVGGISCTSDARRKENIVTIEDALTDIRKLRTVSYDFIGDTDSSSIGFIAQEVEDIYPSLIVRNPNGFLTLSYAGLTPMLTRAIQELDINIADITSLTGEVGTTLVETIRNWLADATNGIQNIFAKRVTTEELCIEDVCVTRDEFLQLLENAGVDGGNDNTPPVQDEDTEDIPSDDTPPDTDETPAGTEDTPVDGEQPIDPEPAVDEPIDEDPLSDAPPADEPAPETDPAEPAL